MPFGARQMPRNEDPPTHHGLTANRIIGSRAAPFLMAAFAASCAQSSVPIGAAYSQELAGRTAGAPRSCITAVSNANLNAIDSSTFVYHSGDTIYVNHPSSPCSAIAPLNTLIVDAQQGHYC